MSFPMRLFRNPVSTLSLLLNLCPVQVSAFSRGYSAEAANETARRTSVKWTEEELDILRAGVVNKQTIWQITNELPNRTYGAVRSQYTKTRQELGMSYTFARWPQQDLAQLEAAKESGMSLTALCGIFPKRTKHDIMNRWHRLEQGKLASRNDEPVTKSRSADVVDRRDRLGQDFAQIARDMRWTCTKVIQVYRTHRPWSPSTPTAPPAWTAAENAQLLHLHGSGNTNAYIAKSIGRTEHAIKGKLCESYSIGTATPKITRWTAEEEQRLVTLKKAGFSWDEISAALPGRTTWSLMKVWSRISEGADGVKRK